MSDETTKAYIPLLALGTSALDGYVEAGDSADRSVRAIWRTLTPNQRKNFTFWLGEAHKMAKKLQESSEISAFRESVQEDNRRHPMSASQTYTINGKTYKPAGPKKATKEEKKPPSLIDLLGL